MGSFTEKLIQVNFVLANGMFIGGGNTKLVRGLMTDVHIRKPGQPEKNACVIRLYGMLPEDINALSTAGINPLAVQKNLVQVQAGDSDGLTTLFQGEITGAWANYATPPDLNFEVHAVDGHFPSIAPAQPVSFQGAVSANQLFASRASLMGYHYEPNDIGSGVSLLNPYLHGTAMDQVVQMGTLLNCEVGVDSGVLFVAKRGSPRQTPGTVPIISPTTGLIGYPIWNKALLEVHALLNPAFTLGGSVIIQDSMVKRANGTWRIHGLEHRVTAKNHRGEGWVSTLRLVKAGV